MKEACWINEGDFWKPDRRRHQRILRHGRVRDVEDGLSGSRTWCSTSARTTSTWKAPLAQPAAAARAPRARRDGGRRGGGLPVVSVRIERDGQPAGQVETVRALRDRLRRRAWCAGHRPAAGGRLGQRGLGVMDLLVTDSTHPPQVAVPVGARQPACWIYPARGAATWYCGCTWRWTSWATRSAWPAGRSASSSSSPRRGCILPALHLEEKVPWWSVYGISQRTKRQVRRRAGGGGRLGSCRACSSPATPATRTAKASHGGMNFSIRDGFNLGQKLAAVLRGQCD